jgi:ADP-ribose pyrophosphatase
MREERLDGDRVYSGRVVRLEVDRVRLPGGAHSVREVVRHRGAAVVLPVLDDGRVVLVRQYRYPVGEELLELPAGTLEDGEDPLECAARELAEETGYGAGTVTVLGRFYAAPGYTDEALVAVLATGLAPARGAAPDPDEIIETVTLRPDELLRLIEAGEIRDSKTLATVLLAQLHGHLNSLGFE